MTTAPLLVALIALAYLGTLMTSPRRAALPSSVEYVVLGFVLGPQLLGVMDRAVVALVEPIAQLALGWIALGAGFEFGFSRGKRVTGGRLLAGLLRAGLVGSTVAAGTWYVLDQTKWLSAEQSVLLSLGVGALACQRSRHVIRWLVAKHGAKGPVTAYLEDLASSAHGITFAALAVMFAMAPTGRLILDDDPVLLAIAGPALGVVLGGLAAALLRTPLKTAESWGVVMGTAGIGIGLAVATGLMSLSTLFFMGAALRFATHDVDQLSGIFADSHRTVLLPLLLLAGLHLQVPLEPMWGLLLACALVFTAGATVLGNLGLLATSRVARRGGPPMIGLYLSSGALSLCAGFACALRFPQDIGPPLLTFAVVGALLSDLFGLISVRAILRRAGELPGPTSTEDSR